MLSSAVYWVCVSSRLLELRVCLCEIITYDLFKVYFFTMKSRLLHVMLLSLWWESPPWFLCCCLWVLFPSCFTVSRVAFYTGFIAYRYSVWYGLAFGLDCFPRSRGEFMCFGDFQTLSCMFPLWDPTNIISVSKSSLYLKMFKARVVERLWISKPQNQR